ncbi:DUF5610 domain-containing protein [Pseudoalteromonas piscicida]|uniref:DUF5610 domain-containing protein n=1 Tax=Pseudoalteromonas piscicida TaxID=43662 RepID=A0A2A5JKM3_PSEO7|nr:DUF5610 domain-containing protein [Pseudoalteromonas piscicida]PCK29990.1 hypothetical protein CEX98_20175 [Pseudoalteromonas piscicida]
MKIGQLNQLLNPAMQHKPGKSKGIGPNIHINSDSYAGDKSKLAAKILDDKLAEALGIEKPAQDKKDKPLFDFESIVKNVLDFVQGAVKKAKVDGKDNDELKSMLDDARKGVLQGIDEASEELKGMGAFNSDIEDGIEKSREGIFNGLDDFEKELFEEKSPKALAISAAQFASLSNQAEYAFTTAEGDEVVISFSDAYSQGAAASVAQKANEYGMAYGTKSSHEVSFSIKVNGELNEEEQQAINDMMEDIRNVSDSFFGGEYDEAFDLAKSLNLNSDQITSFTMDLKQSKTSSAIAQYQQGNPMKELEKAFVPLNKQLSDIQEQAKALDANTELPNLLAWMNEGQSRLNEFLDYASSFFSKLNEMNKEQVEQKQMS